MSHGRRCLCPCPRHCPRPWPAGRTASPREEWAARDAAPHGPPRTQERSGSRCSPGARRAPRGMAPPERATGGQGAEGLQGELPGRQSRSPCGWVRSRRPPGAPGGQGRAGARSRVRAESGAPLATPDSAARLHSRAAASRAAGTHAAPRTLRRKRPQSRAWVTKGLECRRLMLHRMRPTQ